MAIKERMTEKAGPLPVWAWVLVIGGIIGGYMWYRSKHPSSSSSSSQTPTDTATNQADTIPTSLAAEMQAEYTLSNQLGNADSNIATLATNVGSNTLATGANTAAENANTGVLKQDTSTDKQLVSGLKSVAHRNPAKGGSTKKTHPRTYTVRPGDNLSRIAARYHLAGGWASLYNANKHTIGSNPNLIRPGQKLVIP